MFASIALWTCWWLFCSSSYGSAIGNKNKAPSNMRWKVSTNYNSLKIATKGLRKMSFFTYSGSLKSCGWADVLKSNQDNQTESSSLALPHLSLSIENSLSDIFKTIFKRGNAGKTKRELKKASSYPGEYCLIWPIRECAAGQGVVFFYISVLHRVCNFMLSLPGRTFCPSS